MLSRIAAACLLSGFLPAHVSAQFAPSPSSVPADPFKKDTKPAVVPAATTEAPASASASASASADAANAPAASTETKVEDGKADEAAETKKEEKPWEPSEPGLEKLEEIPNRFPKLTDALSYEWTLSKGGAVSGMNGSVENGMVLRVGDATFDGTVAEKDDKGERVVLTQTLESGLKIARHIFVNLEQSGVRYVDVFENTTDSEMTVKFGYTASFPNQPGGVYSNTGKISSGELGAKGAGLALQADDDGGRPSVLILFADEKSKLKPKVAITKENEVQAGYALTLAKGEKKALLQWVGQRELTDSRSVRDAFGKVYRRRRLEDARIPEGLPELIVNFDVNTSDGVHAPYAEDLLAVVELCDKLEVERDSEDVLWVGTGSRLTGTAAAAAETFSVDSRFGKMEVKLADVAALQGGGGLGRGHRVYLRDGTVLNGAAAIEGLSIQGSEGWKVDLDMEQLEYLIFRLAPEDGQEVEGKSVFMELHTGDVIATGGIESLPLSFISPWGKVDVQAGAIASMREVKVPSPRYRLVMDDGSELTVFMVAREIELKEEAAGPVKIDTNEVAKLWRAGDRLPGAVDEEEYEEMEELPPGSMDACLLKGSNILAGKIVNEKLNLVSGATVTTLSPEEIASIIRSDDDFSELIPGFEIELRGGSHMTGYFQERTIQVQTNERLWSLPVQHFLAARRNVNSEKN